MDIDTDKIDEAVLALLHLTRCDRFGAAAWKGPYATFSLSSGDSLPIGMNLKALDSLTNVSNRIQVILSGSTSNAEMMHIDSLVDGASGNAAGNLTWTNTAGVASVLRLYLTGAQ